LAGGDTGAALAEDGDLSIKAGQAGWQYPSTGIGESGRGKSEEQDAEQSDGAERRVRAAMQIAQPVESLQGQGEAGEQLDDEHPAGVVIADVLQPVAVLGVVEAPVLDQPAALGHRIERAAADLPTGKVGEPGGLDDFAARLMLPMADHPHRTGFCLPRQVPGGSRGKTRPSQSYYARS